MLSAYWWSTIIRIYNLSKFVSQHSLTLFLKTWMCKNTSPFEITWSSYVDGPASFPIKLFFWIEHSGWPCSHFLLPSRQQRLWAQAVTCSADDCLTPLYWIMIPQKSPSLNIKLEWPITTFARHYQVLHTANAASKETSVGFMLNLCVSICCPITWVGES